MHVARGFGEGRPTRPTSPYLPLPGRQAFWRRSPLNLRVQRDICTARAERCCTPSVGVGAYARPCCRQHYFWANAVAGINMPPRAGGLNVSRAGSYLLRLFLCGWRWFGACAVRSLLLRFARHLIYRLALRCRATPCLCVSFSAQRRYSACAGVLPKNRLGLDVWTVMDGQPVPRGGTAFRRGGEGGLWRCAAHHSASSPDAEHSDGAAGRVVVVYAGDMKAWAGDRRFNSNMTFTTQPFPALPLFPSAAGAVPCWEDLRLPGHLRDVTSRRKATAKSGLRLPPWHR